jgi:Carbamoylphosphate synthase large subunit (split gene in MJ)
MKALNVLFIGGAKRVSFAEYLKRSAESQGYEFNLYSYELEKEVPLAVMAEIIIGLRWKDAQLIPHLTEVIREKQINLVLPFVDPAIAVSRELKELLPDVFIPVSNMAICRTMFDKCLAAEWFESLNLPVPRTCHPDEELFFPLIAKPKTGSASKGIVVIQDKEAFDSFMGKYNLDEYLLQQYVEKGEEFTVDCYVSQNKEIISVVPRIRLEQSGGEAVRSKTIHDETIESLSRQLLQSGALEGPITIQFIRDRKTGETYFMEINPRYGGAVITSFAAGADTTRTLIEEISGQKASPITDWKADVLMTRYFKEVIFYADNH